MHIINKESIEGNNCKPRILEWFYIMKESDRVINSRSEIRVVGKFYVNILNDCMRY